MDPKKKPKRTDPDEPEVFPVTPDTVREFCDIACANDLAELDVQVGDFHLRIMRTEPEPVMPFVTLPMQAAPAHAAAPPAAVEARPADENRQTIKSPLAGVFYRAPSPGAPPYVEEGDEVREGQTVCIIEAMKLMNEISAEMYGRVRRILVQNAQVVEAGQDLMIVDPVKE
ncbi:MAG: acetyl-CoA carboxylase biotin carboxyl carrier protein [Candidatus Xenobia bacterium]